MKKIITLILLSSFLTSCVTIQSSGLKTKLPEPFPNRKIDDKGEKHQVNLIFNKYACYKKDGDNKLFQVGWFTDIDKQIYYQQIENRLKQSLTYINLNCKNRNFVVKQPTIAHTYKAIIKTAIISFITTAILTGTTTYFIMK